MSKTSRDYGDWKFTIYKAESHPLLLQIHGQPTVMVFTSEEKFRKLLHVNEGCSPRPLNDAEDILEFLADARDQGAKRVWIDPDYEISIAGKHQIPDLSVVIEELESIA